MNAPERVCPIPECPPLTESEIDSIAEKAAEKAIEKLTAHVYQEVGKGVVSKLLWIAGATVVGLYFYLRSVGVLK